MIYYVEDDTNIRDLTVYALAQAGFTACGFSCAAEFFDACATRPPRLVLLDIMLPEVDGLEILAELRASEQLRRVPVMMLTAKGTEFDTVTALDAGADDYLAKPFGMMELISRVNALLRRAEDDAPAAPEVLEVGAIRLLPAARTVEVAGTEVELTLKEFDLLRELMSCSGEVLTRSQLFERVWDMSYAEGTRTVDVHVQTLRQKLSAAREGTGRYIQTVRGVGYCLKEA